MSQITQSRSAARSVYGLVRIGVWWLPKVGPALAVAYCAALVLRVPGWATVYAIATVAFVGLCAGTYGYLLNDIFDRQTDLQAGKPNRMAAFSPWQRFSFCALALGLGFVPALFLHTSHTTLAALILEYAVLTVYSLPPIRLKTRGALGLLCDAAGAHVVANLYVLSVVADRVPSHTTGPPSRPVLFFVAAVCAWELCFGLLGILVHQIEDRDNDRRSCISTFATSRTLLALRTPATLLYVGELLAFTTLCFLLRNVAPLVGVAAALYAALLALKIAGRWSYYKNFADQTIQTEWWLSSHSFYETYFPFVAALQCALLHPQVAMLAALHMTLFVPALRTHLRDGFSALFASPLPEEPA